MRRKTVVLLLAVAVGGILASAGSAAADTADTAGSVGVVDPTTGRWYLLDASTGETTSFYYGNPGDEPFVGDWDCDGVDTPGLFRRSDGYVYLRDTNSQGVADIAYYFGNPDDIPVVGDFDGDGCDTVSLYRPDEARFYLVNRIGADDLGLGAADTEVPLGDHGDLPLSGDFDGDGVDSVAVARSGVAYLALNTGVIEAAFGVGTPVVVSSGGRDVVGAFRWGTFHSEGLEIGYGNDRHRPIAGDFGPLLGGDEPPPALPPPPDVGVGRRIIYSNGEQRVWLVDEDGSVAKSHPVSGKEGVPALGTYSVYSKSLQTQSYNGITMTHMVRFAHGRRLPYGFHSIPLYPDGRPLQTESELGYFRSGGCVRQAYDDAVFLYEWAPVGTVVHVVP
jgi:hypothetical protein